MEELLDPHESALLIFDMLNGHVKAGGSDIPPRWRVGVPNIQKLLAAARAASMMVVYAAGWHRADGGTSMETERDTDNQLRPIGATGRSTKPPVAGGTWSSEVIAELAPAEKDFLVPKYRWSAFYGTYLDVALRAKGIRTLVVCGGSTDVGVASTAYSARDRDLNLVMVSDACTAFRPEDNEHFMTRIFPKMARVRTTEQVVAMIAAGAGAARKG